jgi:hypothetical protein
MGLPREGKAVSFWQGSFDDNGRIHRTHSKAAAGL